MRLRHPVAAQAQGAVGVLLYTDPADDGGVTATATVATDGKTGVEMEALTAVSVALLTIYDMAKALDKTMTIGGITLIEKRGGASDEATG